MLFEYLMGWFGFGDKIVTPASICREGEIYTVSMSGAGAIASLSGKAQLSGVGSELSLPCWGADLGMTGRSGFVCCE